MKNKLGLISGFILGVTGFLLVFKLVFLPLIPPSDELAPGMVLILAAMNGALFALIGAGLQRYFVKKRNYRV